MSFRLSKTRKIPVGKRPSERGFTLIELTIAVSIVMILAAIAVPRYSNYMMENRRGEAQHLLYSNSARLQRCLTLSGSYDGNCALRTESAEGHYELVERLSAQSWMLSAVPTSKSGQNKDKECRSLVLTNAGVKSATGDSPESCW